MNALPQSSDIVSTCDISYPSQGWVQTKQVYKCHILLGIETPIRDSHTHEVLKADVSNVMCPEPCDNSNSSQNRSKNNAAPDASVQIPLLTGP